MTTYDYHVGDVGAVIELDTLIDLTGATDLKIHFRRPDGTGGTWTGVQKDSDANKTVMAFTTTAASDLSIAGGWRVNTEFTKNGATKSGSFFHFVVQPKAEV